MYNHFTMRTLTYTITPRRLMEIYQTEKFRDLTDVGRLLNAILFAHDNGAGYQIATFGLVKTSTTETICITDGLLHQALSLMTILVERYKGYSCVNGFENILLANEDYKPPAVILDMRCNGPFRIGTKPKASFLLRQLALNGKDELLRDVEIGEMHFPLATVADVDETYSEVKIGNHPEVYHSIADAVEELIAELTLAAEEFIFSLAKELGLSTVTEPAEKKLKMAA